MASVETTHSRSMDVAGWHQAAQTGLHRSPSEALPTHKLPAKARPRGGRRHPNKERTPYRGPHPPAVRVPQQCRRPPPTPPRLPAPVWRRRHTVWPHYFFLPLPLLPAAAAASLSFLASSFCFCLKAMSSCRDPTGTQRARERKPTSREQDQDATKTKMRRRPRKTQQSTPWHQATDNAEVPTIDNQQETPAPASGKPYMEKHTNNTDTNDSRIQHCHHHQGQSCTTTPAARLKQDTRHAPLVPTKSGPTTSRHQAHGTTPTRSQEQTKASLAHRPRAPTTSHAPSVSLRHVPRTGSSPRASSASGAWPCRHHGRPS